VVAVSRTQVGADTLFSPQVPDNMSQAADSQLASQMIANDVSVVTSSKDQMLMYFSQNP